MLKMNEHEKELIFVGAVGVRNLVDGDSLNRINEYKKANVRTIFYIGDATDTATSIAKSISLIQEDDDLNKKAVTSFAWAKMSQREKKKLQEMLLYLLT